MKVAFYLTNNRNMRDGVTHYATEIMNRLPECEDVEYVGEAFLTYKDSRKAVVDYFHNLTPALPVHTVRTPLPMRWLHKFCSYKIPVSYETLMGSTADVRVFFHNLLPYCKMKGKKIVVIHDLTPLHDPVVPAKKKKKLEADCRNTVKIADIIFTDSEYSRQDIVNCFPEAEEKICVNYCGIDFDRFSTPVSETEREAIRAKYALPQQYLLFIGQARTNKNLPNLLRGYALLSAEVRKMYPLVLANHTKELAKLADELQIASDVRFLSGIDEEDMVGVYQGARALALISTSEGFGLPLIEAMAAGVPTIASDATCLPEICGNASKFVKADDIQSIAEGLNAALTDTTLRESLTARGLERAKCFNWDTTAEKFYNEIQFLLRR